MLIKGLQEFNKIRKLAIPGKISIESYRLLQKGKQTDVPVDTAEFLINFGYAEKAESPRKAVKGNG